jgi:hypothetical protein
MTDIAELERRFAEAIDRLDGALAALAAPRPAAAASAPAAESPEVAALAEALETERTANAQLTERVRAIRERQDAMVGALERRVETLTAQLDAAGIEAQRLRKVNVQLRETVRTLREAAAAGATEPHLINKAMLAELDALRAARQAEMVEMEDILAALDPLIAAEDRDARD